MADGGMIKATLAEFIGLLLACTWFGAVVLILVTSIKG
jgi:hypothetical protein